MNKKRVLYTNEELEFAVINIKEYLKVPNREKDRSIFPGWKKKEIFDRF